MLSLLKKHLENGVTDDNKSMANAKNTKSTNKVQFTEFLVQGPVYVFTNPSAHK